MKIENNNIVITGGSGDIGKYLAVYFAALNNNVFAVDVNDKSFAELTQAGIKCVKCNLADYDEVNNVIADLYKEHNINVIINCAGIIYSAPLVNLLSKEDRKHSRESWDMTIKSNLYTTFYTGMCAAEQMISKRIKGLIINFSSVSAKGNLGQSAYAAAKAGVEALTKVWSKELALFGIRTACIAPGFINTESTAKALNAAMLDKIKAGVPLKRLGEPEEAASAIKFIIENDYFNGKILELDGGVVI